MEKKKLKRTVSGILVSSVLAVTALAPQVSAETVGGSLDNFKMGTAKEFSDVVSTDWYYSNVADAAALGIIQGNPDGTFNPNGNLSIAEALTLASRVNAIFYNRTEDLSSDSKSNAHWADGILNYAEKNGIVQEGYSGNLDNVCTRVQMADMFAKSVPTDNFTEINSMDLAPSQTASEAIATLFKAGVFVGDSSGFRENDSVTRAESAAIINRVVMPSQRVTVTEKIDESDNATQSTFTVNIQPNDVIHHNKLIPNVTLTVTGPNGTDTVTLTKEHFNETRRVYSLPFNIGAYNVGDVLTLTYTLANASSADYADIVSLNYDNETVLKKDVASTITVTSFDNGYLGDDDVWVKDIEIMDKITLIASGDNSVVTVYFKDQTGEPISNLRVMITSDSNNTTVTSDENGMIKISCDEFTDPPKISSLDDRYVEINSEKYVLHPYVKGLNYTVVFSDSGKEN